MCEELEYFVHFESISLNKFGGGRETIEELDMDNLKRKLYVKMPVCDVVQ